MGHMGTEKVSANNEKLIISMTSCLGTVRLRIQKSARHLLKVVQLFEFRTEFQSLNGENQLKTVS